MNVKNLQNFLSLSCYLLARYLNDRPRYLGFRFQWHWLTFHVRLPSLRSSALVPPPLRLLASSGSASHALRLGIESSGGGGSCVLWQNLHGTKTTSALLCLAMAPPMPANIFQNHTFYINDELKILIMAPFELIKGSNIPLGLAGLKCPIA